MLRMNKIKIILVNTFKIALIFYSMILYSIYSLADPIGPGGSINPDLGGLQDAIKQWGTTFSGICVLIAGTLAVSSLILPWRFFKETLGRSSWIGLICAILVYISLSYFGNSIHQYLVSMFQCPLSIIGMQCS